MLREPRAVGHLKVLLHYLVLLCADEHLEVLIQGDDRPHPLRCINQRLGLSGGALGV